MSASSIPSLSSLALASASLNSVTVPEECLEGINNTKFNVWCNLKNEVPLPCRNLMERVEETVSPDHLRGSVDLLFRRFSNELTTRYAPFMEDVRMIPHLHLHALEKKYQSYKTACENQALETLWKDCLVDELRDIGAFREFREIGDFGFIPPPQGYEEIRAWLSSPDNAAFVQQITDIDLMDKGLEYLPTEIGLFTNLEVLYLDKNLLRELPDSICNLTALRNISLTSNKLTCLPNAFGNLGALEIVLLRKNCLESLPNSIGTLVNLTSLNLESNRLSSLPQSICNLPRLETLHLGHNNLCAIPAEIGNLPSLAILSLYYNFLFTLPPSIFANDAIMRNDTSHCRRSFGGNPYVFNLGLEQSRDLGLEHLRDRLVQFKTHTPESILARLLQAIANGIPPEKIRRLYDCIDSFWKEKIIDCSTEGRASVIASIQSEDQDVLFIAGLSASAQAAAHRMFSELPSAQKDKVYHEIARMNDVIEDPLTWGKEHVFDHSLIFVDALEKTLLANSGELED
ncbi:MAG: leucine-rich repeat domain-containing protein [Verrucomicrobia bacterium]|nr:leucine-rich repeat domain-containing protein [Verrucomicrobiota bacterium]